MVTWVMWNVVSVRLKIVSVLVQIRCTVYAKHNVGSKIILGLSIVLLGDEAQVEA
jgi:hypothetical protein